MFSFPATFMSVHLPVADSVLRFGDTLPDVASFSRASPAYSGLDSEFSEVANNAPRYSDNGIGVFAAASQLIPNGAAYGADNTTSTPVGWSGLGTTNGVTLAVVGRGTIRGLPAIRIRMSGTCTLTSSLSLFFNASTTSPAVQNNTLNMSLFLQEVAGDISDARFRFAFVERTSVGAAAKATTYSDYFIFGDVSQRFDKNYLVTEATAAFLQVGLNIAAYSGTTYDLDILMACPQLTASSIPTPPWPSDPFDQVGIAGSNLIRNLVSGAAVGAPGTLPTNWATSLTSGISREVIAVGADYIDIRLSGTASVATSATLLFETTTQIAAVQNDVIGMSTDIRLVAGSMDNVTSITFTAIEYSAAPAVLANNNGVALPVSGAGGHFSARFVMSDASTVVVRPGLRIVFVVGQPVDITLRISSAVLQKNANVAAYSDHPAEILTAALGSSSAEMTLSALFTPGIVSGAYTLLQVHEGSGQDGIRIRSTDGYDLVLEVLNGGVVVEGPTSICDEALYSGKTSVIALAWDAQGVKVRLNKLPLVTSGVVDPQIPANATVHLLGNASGAQQSCGELFNVSVWNEMLTSAQIAAIAGAKSNYKLVVELMYGQSISTGSNGFFPVGSTYQLLQEFATPTLRNDLLMLSVPPTVYGRQSDVRLGVNRTNGSATASDQEVLPGNIINFERFVSRQLTTSTNAQTPIDSTIKYMIEEYNARYNNRVYLLAMCLGVGGTQIQSLRAVPSIVPVNGHTPYNDIIVALDRAVSLANANGMVPQVDFVHWYQGESNATTPVATYFSELQGLQSELNATVLAATGQADNPRWISGSFSTFNAGATGSIIALANAQKLGLLTLCTPYYPFYYNSVADGFNDDYLHLNGVGYLWLGEYAAKVERAWHGSGRVFKPTMPHNISKSGATYRLAYDCEVAPIVLDTTTVDDPGNYGFQIFDSSGAEVTIDSVAVAGTDIVITTSTDPGLGSEVAYAMQGHPGARIPATMARGCVRDSDPAVSEHNGMALWNWGVHFRFAVDGEA